MQYDSYTLDEEAHTAIILYSYNEQVVYFLIAANNESATGGSQNDLGKRLREIQSKYTVNLKTELWEIKDGDDTQPAYALQWNYFNVYYELLGKIYEDEMEKIADMIMY